MCEIQVQGRWFVLDAAARAIQAAFPGRLKGRSVPEQTLKNARATGGALTTVGRMVFATDTREHALALLHFVEDCIEAAHPMLPIRELDEWHRIEHDANAEEDRATIEFITSPTKENALRLYAASTAESVAELGRRAELLRRFA
jgi:hypothetical protein